MKHIDMRCDGGKWQGDGQKLVRQMRHRQNVTDIFDDYADEFDDHLVNALKYEIPSILRSKTESLRFRRCLDMGCGTGLVGREFRDSVSEWLEGVDLSDRMLAKAAERNKYDALHHRDLLTHLRRQQPSSFDLLIAADVLVYVHPLEPVFREVRRVLEPGGYFLFSVEAVLPEEAEEGFLERDSERFAHSRPYLCGLAAGFELICVEGVALRLEDGMPLAGDVYVFCRAKELD